MHRVAVMQGRLSPPVGSSFQAFPLASWADEFPRAAAAGIDGIEWIYDVPDADVNPLATDDGRARLRALSEEHGVALWSCCADYFMSRPLARATAAARDALEQRLHALIGWASSMGIDHMVIPFVDASALRTSAERQSTVALLTTAAQLAARAKVELHLESDLPPAEFAQFLERLPFDAVRANYDSGNSASLGYSPTEEFAAYGARIGSVHLKDRKRGAGTVTPGTGDADFAALFAALAKVRYVRDFTLQVARGASGDEVAWIAAQRAFFAPMIASLGQAVR